MLRVAVLLIASLTCAAPHAQAPAKPAPADKAGIPALAPPAQPKGVYASINQLPMNQTIRQLETSGQRGAATREVLKNAASQMPPVLYAVANVLSGDRPETAIFWYHVGRVRAVYDALRCKDESARNMIPALGRKLSPELVRSQYFQRDRLASIAAKAIEWDAQNPRNYDQRWICLYGRIAQTSSGADPAEVQLPESEWPAILKRVHDAHLKSVQDFAAQPAPTR